MSHQVAQTGLELLYLMFHCLSFPGIWDSGSQPQRPGRRVFFFLVCVWGEHTHASLQRSDKGAGSPRTGVTGICKSPFPQCVLGTKLVSILLMGHRSSPCITFLYTYLKAHCSWIPSSLKLSEGNNRVVTVGISYMVWSSKSGTESKNYFIKTSGTLVNCGWTCSVGGIFMRWNELRSWLLQS